MKNRPSDIDSLFLTSREFVAEPVAKFVDLEFVHHVGNSFFQSLPFEPKELPEVFDHFFGLKPTI